MNMAAPQKKIVWLAHEANLSGANIAMLEYVDALAGDYSFHVILPHTGNMKAALQQRNIPGTVIHQYSWTQKIPWWNCFRWCRTRIRSWIAIRQTVQLLLKEDPGLVFTNTLVPFTAAVAAHRLHIPHIWWIHEFGQEDFGFKIGWGDPLSAYKKMQQWSRLIICNSQAVADKFQKQMPAAGICTVYQPVSWKGNHTTGEKPAKYLMFGQITPSKGHREVLQALALNRQKGFSSGGLHIKGPCQDQVYLEALQQIVTANNLQDEVKIETGYFVAEELVPLYKVLLVASRSEAFGRVIVEANKAGLKVVVKNSGGAPELVNETNGLLYNTEAELCLILSGEKKIPEGTATINYDEAKEIEKLKHLLKGIL
jgi:glycosyltransferase involved in cell wall biosynthesis